MTKMHVLNGPSASISITSLSLAPLCHFQHANEDVERMLLGNKCDMEDKRVVPKAKGEQVRPHTHTDPV